MARMSRRGDIVYTWWSRRHAKIALQRPGSDVAYHKHFGAGGYDVTWETDADNVWKPGDASEKPAAWIKLTST